MAFFFVAFFFVARLARGFLAVFRKVAFPVGRWLVAVVVRDLVDCVGEHVRGVLILRRLRSADQLRAVPTYCPRTTVSQSG